MRLTNRAAAIITLPHKTTTLCTTLLGLYGSENRQPNYRISVVSTTGGHDVDTTFVASDIPIRVEYMRCAGAHVASNYRYFLSCMFRINLTGRTRHDVGAEKVYSYAGAGSWRKITLICHANATETQLCNEHFSNSLSISRPNPLPH